MVSTTIAVDGIHPTYFHVAANFNFSRTETIIRLVVPAIMPEVVTALRFDRAEYWPRPKIGVLAAQTVMKHQGEKPASLFAEYGERDSRYSSPW